MSERNERRLGLSGNSKTTVKPCQLEGSTKKWSCRASGVEGADMFSQTCNTSQHEVGGVAPKESVHEILQLRAVDGRCCGSRGHHGMGGASGRSGDIRTRDHIC